jgi:hypothetical protein
MRQHLAGAFPQGACDLYRFHAEIPSIIENNVPDLLVHASPQAVLVQLREADAVGILDGHKDDQIKPLHRAPYPRKPGLNIEPVRVPMCDQVRKDVCRASIEEVIFLAFANTLNRALKLQLEILERRHLRKLVTLLFKKVVGLIHCYEGRERSAQLFDQGCLPGPMCT